MQLVAMTKAKYTKKGEIGMRVYKPIELQKARSRHLVKLYKALPEKQSKDEELSEGAHRTPPEGYPKDRDQYAIPAHYKYPLDTEKHVRAAISYFSIPKNANQYTKDQQKSIWKRIKRAAKKYGIELSKDAGPPSVEKKKDEEG